MIHKKARNDFDMVMLRKRAVKSVRKRHKKSIKKSVVDKVWKDYCEFGIIKPLLKGGKVQIDKNFSIEIVGRTVENDKFAFGLFSKGKAVSKFGGIKDIDKSFNGRKGFKYKIVVIENNYKGGKLIFKADSKLSKRVHEELKNTSTYYRIEL
jgi:hypothetical protein